MELLVKTVVGVFSLYSNACSVAHFHSTDDLSLTNNSLIGNIPKGIGFLTVLSESSFVWFLTKVIIVVLFIVCSARWLMLLCYFHSIAYLNLGSNGLTGTIPSEVGALTALCESSVAVSLS